MHYIKSIQYKFINRIVEAVQNAASCIEEEYMLTTEFAGSISKEAAERIINIYDIDGKYSDKYKDICVEEFIQHLEEYIITYLKEKRL